MSLARSGRGERLRSVLTVVWRNGDLRRTQVAYAAFISAEWSVWIALLVSAYSHGGATTAGLVAVIQLLPAAAFAPFAAVLADRRPAARVLTGGYVAQAVAMGATAIALAVDAPFPLVVACATLAAMAVTISRPTMAVLLPALARHPEELTAANVVSGFIEAVAVLAAPALTGVLLGVSGPAAVFGVMSVLVLAGAIAVAPIHGPSAAPAGESARTVALSGFKTLAGDASVRRLVGILAAGSVALGMLDLLSVVLAIGVLGMGNSGAGYLNASLGLGGALAVVATASLVGRPRLMPSVLRALALWAIAFGLLAAWTTVPAALALFAVAGGASTMIDVGSRTLLQRTAPSDVLARVFGVLESLEAAAMALGSLIAPLLVVAFGSRAALLATALVLPCLALLGGRRLFRLDASAHVPVVEISLLRSLPLFAELPAPEIEGLARSLEPVSATAGTAIVTQGEIGDRYYAIAHGELEASESGQHRRVMRRGDGFGEIALLRAVPRTATVRALDDVALYALAREPFLAAVTGHAPTADAAAAIASERLGPPDERGRFASGLAGDSSPDTPGKATAEETR